MAFKQVSERSIIRRSDPYVRKTSINLAILKLLELVQLYHTNSDDTASPYTYTQYDVNDIH